MGGVPYGQSKGYRLGLFQATASGRVLTFVAGHLKVCLLEAAIRFPMVKDGSRPKAD